jgi:AraC family transcriptional activator of pobA
MNPPIPTYQLEAFAQHVPAPVQVFFPEYGTAKPQLPLHQPYRGDYYKISLCLRGTAELKVNLQTCVIRPGSLILATPDVIKQWQHVAPDYETLSVFFTRDFILTNNAATGQLGFLVAPSPYVLRLSATEAASIAASFRFLEQKYRIPNVRRTNILHSILTSLLFEIGTFYDQQPAVPRAGQPRAQQLAAAFRALVRAHCTEARSVGFYAAALCITPKHLTELVKQVTGRTASSWIAEAVVLEAKARLQNPALTVGQVAESLQFADQFAFSRFFKNSTGLSPTAYRQAA